MTALKTRRPTGIVPWPFLLVEGDEGAGKTFAAAEFSASSKIGQTYWLDLAEGSADEYAQIEGARYLIIVHDGTYRSILEQIQAVWEEARRAAAAGEKPVVLVIDCGSALWRMLKTWTHERARRSRNNAAILESDPDAAIDVAMNLWNDAIDRWMSIIHLLQTFPGIVIMTARGQQVTAVDEDGRPIKERGTVVREWKVSAQKHLGFDSSVWVRMRRGEDPQVIKARSLRMPVHPSRPLRLTDFSIEDLIFNRLGCSVESQPRQMPALVGDRVQPWLKRLDEQQDVEELRKLWWAAAEPDENLSRAEVVAVRAAVERRVAQIENPETEMGHHTASDADRLRAAAERQAAERQADADGSADQPEQTPAPAAPARKRAAKKAPANQ